MKINRIALLIIVITAFGLIHVFGGIQSQNGSVNSSPQSIVTALLMGTLAIWCPRKDFQDEPDVPIGLWTRFVALYLDATVAMGLIIGIGIIPILVIEYFVTGHWQWSYERTSWQARDMFSFIMIFSLFAGLFYYFFKHAALGKPTPGQYIMGYRIAPAGHGRPNYKLRTFLGFFAYAFSILTLIIYRGVKDGIYPWDEKSNTRAIGITT